MNPHGPNPHPLPEDGPPHDRGAHDPPPDDGASDATTRRRAAARAGHVDDPVTARRLVADPDPGVRATALGALVRLGALDGAVLAATADDADPGVRRRLAEELGRHRRAFRDALAGSDGTGTVVAVLVGLLADDDPLTAEAAAWALGEVAGADAGELDDEGDTLPTDTTAPGVVAALVGTAGHDDPLVREAVVAALGAIGDPAGLDAILAGTTDRPAVRRRAVLALAPFLDRPGVDVALQRATEDRDWQVRQAADLLCRDEPAEGD